MEEQNSNTPIQKIFEIELDAKRPVSNREFELVTGDSGNVLRISLYDLSLIHI